jgi:hypothetical protein
MTLSHLAWKVLSVAEVAVKVAKETVDRRPPTFFHLGVNERGLWWGLGRTDDYEWSAGRSVVLSREDFMEYVGAYYDNERDRTTAGAS